MASVEVHIRAATTPAVIRHWAQSSMVQCMSVRIEFTPGIPHKAMMCHCDLQNDDWWIVTGGVYAGQDVCSVWLACRLR